MKTLLLSALLGCASFVSAQFDFSAAYTVAPYIPEGLLEGVAWTNTRMEHLSNQQAGCTGIPQAYGVMGLHDQGQNYFRENGTYVAQLSGISVDVQKQSANSQILAYALAFNQLMSEEVASPQQKNDPHAIRRVLHRLSAIPDSGAVNQLARDLEAYAVFDFMSSAQLAAQYPFTPHNFDLEAVFGAANYQVLSAKKIILSHKGIRSDKGDTYKPAALKSTEYGPAIWNPAATCNFNSRNGVAVSAITIHTVQGTYAGCISWFQNCSASVSAHYVVRSVDGQVTQMVSEADKAWHVGSENPYTIGYEHEGYVNNASWYTEAMYVSSANLSRDIVNSGYGINPLRTFDGPATAGTNVLGGCIRIKGHQHYPNQTHVDPGINWNWEHYYQLINDPPSLITVTASSGTLYDTGGPSGNYPDDQRQLWLIQPSAAASITLEFTAFDLEANWDYLYIYDGDSLNDPLIGTYTGTSSPGTIISSGGSLLLEFRSDCSTTAPGWIANYNETTPDATPPLTAIQQSTIWHTDDFQITFTDTDAQSTISDRFYLIARKTGAAADWSSDGNYGFAFESFADGDANWYPVTGIYSVNGGAYSFSDEAEQNSNAYMAVAQSDTVQYLYEWDQTITSTSTNQRAGMHFFCDNPNLPNRGNSYFVYLRESDDKVQIYSVDNDVFTLEADVPFTINQGQTYTVKTVFNPVDGMIRVYVDNAFVVSWQDLAPLQSGAYISLRTGGCSAIFDNIHVYVSRNNQATVPAGFSDLLLYESDGAVSSGMARSLAMDAANNWSVPYTEEFLLDFTAPAVDFIHDGPANDIDTFTTTTLEANWNTLDLQSGISAYEIAIGTLPNLDDAYPWTAVSANTAFSTVLSNPVYNQIYYLSLRATNNAGLTNQFMSDGQRFINDLGLSENVLEDCFLYPNPAQQTFAVSGSFEKADLSLYDAGGRLALRIDDVIPGQWIHVSELARGSYSVVLASGSSFVVTQLILQP